MRHEDDAPGPRLHPELQAVRRTLDEPLDRQRLRERCLRGGVAPQRLGGRVGPVVAGRRRSASAAASPRSSSLMASRTEARAAASPAAAAANVPASGPPAIGGNSAPASIDQMSSAGASDSD
jgi:hypothetical protein